MIKLLKHFLKAQKGQIALSMALAAPVLFAVAGLAIDYGSMTRQHAALQGLADNAAIAGSREMSLSNNKSGQVAAVVKAYVTHSEKKFLAGLKVKVTVHKKDKAITVKIAHPWKPVFAHFLNAGVTPVVASAKAQLLNAGQTCMIILKTKGEKALYILENARLKAKNCVVYSNSTHEYSIWLDQDGSISAGLICTTGGVKYNKPGLVSPPVTTDCPPIPDPLKDRFAPSSDPCPATIEPRVISDELVTLFPGTYCGGLKIEGASQVTLSPGIYVINGGGFEVTDKAIIKGAYTGFYFTGVNATFKFEGETSISLTAPKDGPLAGVLFFQDRDALSGQSFEIASDNARTLLGTIYLPKGTLRISANAPVADQSAYTAIIVDKLDMGEGPELVLNSDYEATDVPVPTGLRGGKIVLVN